MGSMSVRNIPEDEMDALKRIAASNNRSAEAEVRHLISKHIRAHHGEGFGSSLHAKFGGLIDQDFEFDRERVAYDEGFLSRVF